MMDAILARVYMLDEMHTCPPTHVGQRWKHGRLLLYLLLVWCKYGYIRWKSLTQTDIHSRKLKLTYTEEVLNSNGHKYDIFSRYPFHVRRQYRDYTGVVQ